MGKHFNPFENEDDEFDPRPPPKKGSTPAGRERSADGGSPVTGGPLALTPGLPIEPSAPGSSGPGAHGRAPTVGGVPSRAIPKGPVVLGGSTDVKSDLVSFFGAPPALERSLGRVVESPRSEAPGPSGDEPGDQPQSPEIQLAIVGSYDRRGLIGRCVQGPRKGGDADEAEPAKPFKVRATADGKPMAGLMLRVEGPGFPVEVPGYSLVTNGSGEAAFHYVLGPEVGSQPVKVSVDGGASVTFDLEAARPGLITNFPDLKGKELLAGSADGFVSVDLLSPIGDVPNHRPLGVQTAVALEVLEDGKPVDESRFFINPRSRSTTKLGEATFILIPLKDVEGDFEARLKIPDFPKLEPTPVTFKVVKEKTTPATALHPEFTALPALIKVQGAIASRDHPVTLTADLAPLMGADPRIKSDIKKGYKVLEYVLQLKSLFLDPHQKQKLEFVHVMSPEVGGSTPSGWGAYTRSGSTFAVKVKPAKDTVGSLPTQMRATMWVALAKKGKSGTLIRASREEFVAVGVPEVRLVERDGIAGFREVAHVIRSARGDAPDDRAEYFLEARMALDEPSLTSGGSDLLDSCRKVAEIPGSRVQVMRLDKQVRYSKYRSATSRPLVYIAQTSGSVGAPTSPGPVLVEVPTGGYVRPFAFAQEKEEGPETSTRSALRFFSTGPFRDTVIGALTAATSKKIYCDDLGYVSLAEATMSEPDNAVAMQLRSLIRAQSETRVEQKLRSLELLIGKQLFRSTLWLVSNEGFVADIEAQARVLEESFEIKIKTDADESFLKVLFRTTTSHDIVIMNSHGDPYQGIWYQKDRKKRIPLEDLQSNAPFLFGPAIMGIAGCKSLQPAKAFLRPTGPAAIIMARSSSTAGALGVRGMLSMLGLLFGYDPTAPPTHFGNFVAAGNAYEARFPRHRVVVEDRLIAVYDSSAKKMSDLSPYGPGRKPQTLPTRESTFFGATEYAKDYEIDREGPVPLR